MAPFVSTSCEHNPLAMRTCDPVGLQVIWMPRPRHPSAALPGQLMGPVQGPPTPGGPSLLGGLAVPSLFASDFSPTGATELVNPVVLQPSHFSNRHQGQFNLWVSSCYCTLTGWRQGNKTQTQPPAALSLWGQDTFQKRTFALEIAMNSPHPGCLKASVHSVSGWLPDSEKSQDSTLRVLRHSL